MSGSSSNQGDDKGGSRSPEEIQDHIEATRQDLAETIDALSAKADVKARAKEQAQLTKQRAADRVQATKSRAADQVGTARVKVSDAAAQGKDAVTDDEGSVRPAVPIAAVGVAVVVVGLVIIAARRRRR
jgi:ElaB/YqjD/DUF883 family membrane-anchored ribosome-binding protein